MLKKENRVLKEEHQKMMNTLKKYHVQTIDQFANTDPLEQPASEKKNEPIQLD